MSKITSKILGNLSKKSNGVTGLSIEKSSVSSDGTYAKVLFRVKATKAKTSHVLKDANRITVAFEKALNSKARLVEGTIVSAGNDGYFAFVELNRPRVELEVAMMDGSGFDVVSANVFSDTDDNIWTVESDAEGRKMLMRTMPEDLKSLLATRTTSHMAVASAGVPLSAAFKSSDFVRFYDAKTFQYRDGIALDTATVVDLSKGKAMEVSSLDVVAYSDTPGFVSAGLTKASGSKTKTFVELAAGQKRDVVNYIRTLYKGQPAFMRRYLQAVNNLLEV